MGSNIHCKEADNCDVLVKHPEKCPAVQMGIRHDPNFFPIEHGIMRLIGTITGQGVGVRYTCEYRKRGKSLLIKAGRL